MVGIVNQTSSEEQLKVYGYYNSPRCMAAMITAEYCQISCELVDTHPAGSRAGFYDEPYASNFPFGKVPGFSHNDFFLAETSVILPYITSVNDPLGLAGKGVQQKAQVQQWVAWGTSMAFPTLQPWLDPHRNHGFFDKDAVAAARKETYDLFAILDKILSTRTYLVGDSLSLGDIMVAAVVGRACQFIFDRKFREANPNVFKHYELVASEPSYVKHAGPIKYLEVENVSAGAAAQLLFEEAKEKMKAANARWNPVLMHI